MNYFTEVIKSYLNIKICQNNKKIQEEQMLSQNEHRPMGFAIEEEEVILDDDEVL